MVEEVRWMISFDFSVISFEGRVTRPLTRNVNNGEGRAKHCYLSSRLHSLIIVPVQAQNCDTIVLGLNPGLGDG